MAAKRTRMSASERREQLIAVARGLFAERGFDATSVEEVAAHMVNLAWNGLRGLKAEPTLHSGPVGDSKGSSSPEGTSGPGADSHTGGSDGP